MKTSITSFVASITTVLCVVLTGLGTVGNAHARQEASTVSALSAVPVASLAAGSAVAGSVVILPIALSTSGAVLVIKAVESSARGTLLVLERASDGAQASIEILGKGLVTASLLTGMVLTVSVINAGVILSRTGEAIAFIANGLGNALLHDEQLTR